MRIHGVFIKTEIIIRVYILGVCVLLIAFAWLLYAQFGISTYEKRKRDMNNISKIFNDNTNILSNNDLMNAVERLKIKLYSPIPQDRTKVCYQLVNPWISRERVIDSSTILVREINTTDTNSAFAVLMECSVQIFPYSRLMLEQSMEYNNIFEIIF